MSGLHQQPGIQGPLSTLSPEAQAIRNAETNLTIILGICITLHVLALIAVSLRTYIRVFVIRIVGMDDYTMIAAMFCTIGGMILISIQATAGLGRHQDTISKVNFTKYRHCIFYYTLICTILGLNLVKISICFLLMRFVQKRWYRICLWGVIIFMVIYTFACWGTVIFYCFPITANWDIDVRNKPTSKCYSTAAFNNIALMVNCINLTTDILLAALPVQVLWSLRIERRQKFALIGALSLGWIAAALGVVKLLSLANIPNTQDMTFSIGLFIWSFIQDNISVIAACMPALRPIFQYIGETRSRRSRRGNSNTHVRMRGLSFRHNDLAILGSGGSSGAHDTEKDADVIRTEAFPNTGVYGMHSGDR